jgi:alpha-beta hydrolase superfamily lysophospholipase
VKKFQFDSAVDDQMIQGYIWQNTGKPKAVVAISHGMAEHALRYARFAASLNDAGLEAWGIDHRGHGQSAGPRGLGDFGKGGWSGLVSDLGQFINLVREERADLPVVLFAHSMGSFAAQNYCIDSSDRIDALILSGSAARGATGARTGSSERSDQQSQRGRAGSANSAFEPARTPYDWLSRDDAEVDLYISDPLCGFEALAGTASERRGSGLLESRPDMTDPRLLAGIRADLPVLLVAGDKDPINRNLKGLDLLEKLWTDAGVRQIDKCYYPGGRHEMLNEINRDEVTRDIVDWIHKVLSL